MSDFERCLNQLQLDLITLLVSFSCEIGVAFEKKVHSGVKTFCLILMRTRAILTDDQGDFDSYPDVYGFIEPVDYELYNDLHGPDDWGVYCISRG